MGSDLFALMLLCREAGRKLLIRKQKRRQVRTKGQEDIFIPPNEINGAMQGDLVLVDEALPGRDGRRSGRIARVLTRRNPTIVGIFHYAQHHYRNDYEALKGNYVTPWDERLGGPILIPDGDEVAAGCG